MGKDIVIKIGDYFTSYAAKQLSTVDISPTRSRQSEIGGTEGFRAMFGTPREKTSYQGRYVYLDDNFVVAPEIIDAPVTWYDPRRKNSTRPAEYRLLYRAKARPIISRVEPGDALFVARRDEHTIYMIFAKSGSTMLRQLEWMFGLTVQPGLTLGLQSDSQPELEPVSVEELLGLLDIEVDLSDESLLRRIPKSFLSDKWPTGAEMAKLARSRVGRVDMVGEPDAALMSWVQMEARLFQTLEKHRISEEIGAGFTSANGDVDIDAFLKLSLSVQNRRKSRAGGSLELHIEEILKGNGIQYTRQSITEGRKKPDFIFPSQAAYRDESFPASRLTMLGSKRTLKDRWRQVLNEAHRIENKHLLTLQPGISEGQTAEMINENLQLVIPEVLHGQGFSDSQRQWLMTVSDFISEVRQRQAQPEAALLVP
ncbi:EcoRII C terminal [Arthrobacter sp. ok362]|nr:EcoRII C terminal [Arthrobacter sp. ok362]